LTKTGFFAIFNKLLKILNIDSEECASYFGISHSTVEQWKDGLLVPHDELRYRIIYLLCRYGNGDQ